MIGSLVILGMFLSFIGFENEKAIHDFHLINVDGKTVSLGDYPEAKGFIIIFTCNHCPFAKLYPDRMSQMNSKYRELGVPLIAISSTDTVMYDEDTYTKMIEKSKDEQFNFPYLFDGQQTAAKNFGAKKTPHAFVIWKVKEEWTVQYTGAIDDNGAEPDKVTRHYVEEAVNSLLKGEPVATPKTASIGCEIKLRK